jgi:predicted alpha/beta hydrolase family esterase
MGMSLGGYSAALLATLERELRFAVFLVPLAAIEDFAYQNGRMTGVMTEQLAQHEALKRAQRVISPFARPPQLPAARVVSVAGESDLVTGVEPARKLSQHFGGQLSLFHGGHLLHAGREEAFAPVWRLLGEFAAGALR